MSSSSVRRALACALAILGAASARAQTPARGFALERFVPAPAGAGWFVMDDLAMHGGLGGAIELTGGYARNPLALSGGGDRLSVVSNEAFADLSAAVTYDRFRLSVDFPMPLWLSGFSGTFGGYGYAAPSVSPGANPDSITDVRIGADARLVGRYDGPFRLGLDAQLYVPSNSPVDTPESYLTDGTVRAMFRALAAGDLGPWRYAAQLGVHVRPRDDWPTPGGPDGSEILFGAAAGRSFDLGPAWAAVVGPELWGESAFASLFGAGTTGVEGLVTGRFEQTGNGPNLRVKVGAGGGLDPQFGAPAWRVVVGVELFGGANGH